MHKKIRKADTGMVVPTFNGSPLQTQLNLADWSSTIQSGQNPDSSSKTKRYTLLPDQNWLSWQGPWYDKYLTQQRETLFPNSQQRETPFPDNQQIEQVNNPFNVSLTYTPPDVLKEYSQNLFKNPFEEINSPLRIGNFQEYGNKLWERGQKQTNFNAPSIDDLSKYVSKTIRTTHFRNEPLKKSFQEYINGHLPKPLSELTNVNLNETPVDKKFNTDELNNAYSSLGEYGDAAVRLGHSLGVGIGEEWGDVVSKAATGALVTTNAIKNLKKLKGVKGQNVAKAGNIAAIAGAVSDVASSFLPEKTEYTGDKGNVTETIDTIYDGVSDAAMAFGPVGMLVGGTMKGGKLLGGVMNSVGGGTDGMTTTDAILGSSFLNLTPIGLINGFGGQKAETITKNEQAFEQVGSSYTGTGRAVDDALKKSGKKYGLFSSGARKQANKEILEARRQQNILTDIADYATDRFDIRNSMAAINGNRRRFQMQGGYNQSAISVGRNGMVIKDLQRAKRITSSMKYQKGGKVSDPYQSYLQTLPEYQRDDSNFRVRDYWEFNGRPKDFDEAISKGMFTQHKDRWHAKSVAENPNTGEIEYMKSSNHPTRYMESDWYEKGLVYDEDENGNIISTKLSPGVDGYDDWLNFTKNYELQKTEPYWKYVKRKGTDQPQSFKEGGSLTKSDWLVEVDINNIPLEFRGEDIEEVELDSILPEFKEGGKFNVIPEGALHARKHNIDVEGITKKGIPVVSESPDGKLEQQAEIEREEIIFRLEVTKKIEELAKDGSDEAAIEAGKLLVKEILYNTVDNTNSLI